MTRVMVILKPDGAEKDLLFEICKRIKKAGLTIVKTMRDTMPLEKAEILYGHIKERYPRIWQPLLDYVTSGPSVFIIVEGEGDVVGKLQALRGPSDPSKAPKGTIRGDFAKDQNMVALYEQDKVIKSILHSPDNEKQAKFELELFFGKED